MNKFTFFYGNQPFNFDMLAIPDKDIKYTEKDIRDQLHFKHGTNEVKFRYELLDKLERRKKILTNVISGEISMAAFANIKRTGRFKMTEDKAIDWLSDKIQPFAMLKMPDGSWVEWSLGIFVLTAPNRVEENGITMREIEAYDGLVILKDDKFLERYMIPKGTRYVDAIEGILNTSGIVKINIENTNEVLNKDMEFEPGIEKLKGINDLLNDINWNTLWVDEQGYFTSNRYRSPANRSATQQYYDDELSITARGMSEDLDLMSVANSWVAVASNPEELPLTSFYQNDNPDSPTSTINRGRVIVDFREIDSIANQRALDERVAMYAFNASQIYGYLQFETAINPLHSYSDVIEMRNKQMDIQGKYSETNWTMPLQAGALMKHEVRAIVDIGGVSE